MPIDETYLIWSVEHARWRAAVGTGFTSRISEISDTTGGQARLAYHQRRKERHRRIVSPFGEVIGSAFSVSS